MSLAPGTRLGPYEITAPIGAGGMGEVWRATDTNLGRQVAIKVLPDAFAQDVERLARFEREAKMLATLNHPNIAQIFGLEKGDPSAGSGQGATRALVMEFVEGATLADRIELGRLPVDDALAIARQIAEALEAAHEQGIVHRDLKPANIKVREDGTVKVLDFGLAKALDPAPASRGAQGSGPMAQGDLTNSPTITSPAMTAMGMILGTAAYMSPEQARGKPVDKRADIWAFGCVLYEMLTGKRAFAGEDVSLTLSQVLQRDPDWTALPNDVPTRIRHLIERCLVKDPKRRLRDIGEARLAIDSMADVAGEAPGIATSRFPARWRTVRWIITVLVVAAAFGTAWILKPAVPGGESRVVRLTVALPPGEQVAVGTGTASRGWLDLALSSDGTQLVYGSNGHLYLRPLDALAPRRLQGTQNARAPFFSPDGRWIGFFAQGQLRKLSVTDGSVQTLCDAPAGAGGTWSADGTIYFAPTNNSGLMKVSQDGGTPEPLTSLDRNRGEITHRFPQVLPDGASVLLSVWRGPGNDETNVELVDVRSGNRTVLVTGASTGRYLRSGHLLYSRGEELNAARFDLTSRQVAGAPVPLGIQVSNNEAAFFATSDVGTLAYLPGGFEGHRRLVLVDHQGGIEALTSAPARAYEDVAISPDGLRAALTACGPTCGIWIHNLTRHDQTLVTPPASGSSQWPVWTPDGRIIYRGTRRGFRNLYAKAADGTGDEAKLTDGENLQTATSVSADGKWVGMIEVNPKTGPDLFVRSLSDAQPPQAITSDQHAEDFLWFSPNGKWLAYQSDRSGQDEIYIQPFPGPGDRLTVSTNGGTSPRWARDSGSLFYVSNGAMMMVDVSRAPDIGTPRRLFALGNLLQRYAVTRDGRFLMIQSADPPETGTQVHVVLNFFEELRHLVPAE